MRWAAPTIVLVVGLLATIAAVWYVASTTRIRDELRFRNGAADIERDVSGRLDTYIALLRAGAGLFAASDTIRLEEFRAFVDRIQLRERYPGVQGIGWTRRIVPDERDAIAAAMRREYGTLFRYHPESAEAEHHAILYLEPLDRRNREALGFDMFSHPTRREAMISARDSAAPAASGRVTLVQEIDPDKQTGFLIYVPVYRSDDAPANIDGRRRSLLGFVYSPFRAGDLLNQTIPAEVRSHFRLRVYDGDDTAAARLLFDSDSAADGRAAEFTELRTVEVAGRTWTLAIESLPGLREWPSGAWMVAVLGLMLSGALFGLTRSQSRARFVAERAMADLLASREALRASEERFRTLLEQSPLSTQIFAPDGRTLFVNGAWERLWGGDLAATADYNVLTDPQLKAAGLTPLVRRAFAGEAMVLPGIAYRVPSGERAGVNLWVRAFIYPVQDDAGGLREVVLVHEDISEQKAAEERLRYQLELTETITRNSAEALFLMDAAGRITFMNPAAEAMFGWTHDEIAGRVLHDVLHHTHRDGTPFPMADCPLSVVYRTGVTLRNHEDTFLRKDGRFVDVACSNAPIVRDGHVTAAVLVVSDITERRRADEAMRHTQKLESIGVLAGGIAHDFNNLLTGILGNASLAMRMLPSGAGSAARPMLQDVIRASERAAELTNQLLAYAGKGRFFVQSVQLDALVRELATLIRSSISKKVELRLEVGEHVPSITADASQLQQLIMNLVINGAEAIGDAIGTVLVRVHEEVLTWERITADFPGSALAPGRFVRLEVIDTGEGMDEATRAQIFDPFFTTKFTGRGLGLAAALGIVHGHHGALLVESAIGRGSRFTVMLPAGTEQVGGGPAAGSALAPATPAKGSGTVLVVDDEEAVRGVARAVLEGDGYRVLEADNGRQAVEVFRAHADAVDLVLLDMTMPVMGGEEAIRHLRAIRPDLRVLASSGYGEAEAADRFGAAGATGFLQKPYSADRLTEVVAEMLETGS